MKKKKDEITIRSSAAEYLTYVASIGGQQDSIEMRYEDENIWLTQKMMATLYDVGSPTINEHIKKIYADSELEEAATIRNFRIVQTEGSRQVTRDTKHYSLQMIIAVGFKVNSERAVQFRKWVNQIAKDYTIKGWVMDDERLKRGTYLTEKYFERYGKNGNIGYSLVEGALTKPGAVATTWSHDSHNLFVLGTDENDMKLAQRRVLELQGAYVVFAEGRSLAEAGLTIGGIVSDQPIEVIGQELKEVRTAMEGLGYVNNNVIMSMSTLCLPVSPKLKLTDHGLLTVPGQEHVPLVEKYGK